MLKSLRTKAVADEKDVEKEKAKAVLAAAEKDVAVMTDAAVMTDEADQDLKEKEEVMANPFIQENADLNQNPDLRDQDVLDVKTLAQNVRNQY